jgi:cell division protein FtsX
MDNLKIFWRAINGHVLIVAFLIGLFSAVLIAVQQNLSKAEASLRSSLGVVVFLQKDLPDAQNRMQTLRSQDPEIESILYTSKEQAYQEALKNPSLAKSLQLLRANPVPPSFTLQYSERAWWERLDPAEKLKTIDQAQEIRWDPRAQALFRSLHRWRLWSLRFSAFLGIILAIWSLIGVYRFLALQSRFQEIAVHLGVGLVGGGLAWGIWTLGLRSIQADISTLHPSWVWAAPLLIGSIAAVGCFGLDLKHAD